MLGVVIGGPGACLFLVGAGRQCGTTRSCTEYSIGGFFVGYTELCLCSNERLDKYQATPGFGRNLRVEDGQGLVPCGYVTYGLAFEKLDAKLLSQFAY